MTDLTTGYDMQSNASTQQLWYDFSSASLNAVFMTSQEASGFSDRTSTYLFSDDEGSTWTNVGNVPPPPGAGGVRSGFPAIHGMSFGSVVIANHTTLGSTDLRAQLFINSQSGANDFVNFDPGTWTEEIVWPRLGISNNDIVVFAVSDIGAFTNTFDLNTGIFSGYVEYPGDAAKSYSLSTSVSGKIGHAYLSPDGKAWFRESDDEGLTWGAPIEIFTPIVEDTTALAGMRGINVTYIGDVPKVVFEIYRFTLDLSGYYPGLPSKIFFWSPDLNGGVSFPIADDANVPFYPNQGVTQVFGPIARPVIGKAQDDRALFVTFYAASEDVATTADSTRFYVGYFMMSEDGGETWSAPEKFTPVTNPPLDWRWVSFAPVNPVNGDDCTVHLVMVGDPTAGSQINGAPAGVTAKFYHFSAEIPLISSVEDGLNLTTFQLNQNYPNPFNPSAKISCSVAERTNVILRVFDVLGREVAELVNTEHQAGTYNVTFDASKLSSGIYFYKLTAGNFSETKKMVLMR